MAIHWVLRKVEEESQFPMIEVPEGGLVGDGSDLWVLSWGCLRGLKRQCHLASWTQGSSSERKANLEGEILESRWWAWICASVRI